MTFSLVARCAELGMVGIVITSSSPAVAARCAHVRAGVGAVASQNVTDPTLGPELLDRMAGGDLPDAAIAAMVNARSNIAFRQLVAVDISGRTSIHSGEFTLGLRGEARGKDCAAAGNLLQNEGVPQAMVSAFIAARGAFGDRLVTALQAGRDAGGELGPVRSAGLKIARHESWAWADLRCDWTDDGCPIEAVARAWEVYAPQADAYVQRALDPSASPAYGVPGDP